MAELQTIARPYAKAAFLTAKDSSETLMEWSKNLKILAALCSIEEVNGLIFAPGLGINEKCDTLKALIEKTSEATPCEKFQNLIRLLLENKKMTCVFAISEAFDAMKADFENIVQANVISALPISKDQEQAIIAALSRRFSKQINLSITIDDSLIGGAIIQANDLVIDGSLRGQLSELQTTLAN